MLDSDPSSRTSKNSTLTNRVALGGSRGAGFKDFALDAYRRRFKLGEESGTKNQIRSSIEDIVQDPLHVLDDAYWFSDEARSRLISLAQGHPYLVHLVGKFAFRAAYMNDKPVIDLEDIDAVLQTIAENGSDPVLEGRYRKAVASSRQRESVLKALSENQDDSGEVWTTDAYKAALEAGVDNSSQYVGQLVTEEFGAEIERVRERYYRFKDSLFAAYVKARPPMRGLARDS